MKMDGRRLRQRPLSSTLPRTLGSGGIPLVASLRQRAGIAARPLEFTILTAARSIEARGVTSAEVTLEEKLWTVPASGMKVGAVHEVSLCDRAMSLLNCLYTDETKPDQLVFPAQSSGSLPDIVLSAVLKRMKQSGITVTGSAPPSAIGWRRDFI